MDTVKCLRACMCVLVMIRKEKKGREEIFKHRKFFSLFDRKEEKTLISMK